MPTGKLISDQTLLLQAIAEAGPDLSDAQEGTLTLFDECGPGLRRYVRSLGVPPETAEDIVQETFLSLFRHLCLRRPRANLRGWVFRVSHRLALKARGRRFRSRGLELALEPAISNRLVDPAAGPELQLHQRARQQRLLAVLAALPERQRQCLLLRAEGLRYREIAETLQISLGLVAKSLASAIERLSTAERR